MSQKPYRSPTTSQPDRAFKIVWDKERQQILEQQFVDYAKFTGQALVDLVKEEAALTCREAMVYSPPLDGAGGGQGDKKIAETWGNAAVARDVEAVIMPDSKSLAAAVSPATGSGNKFAKWKQGKRPKAGVLQKIYDDQDFARSYSKARNLFIYRAYNLVGPGGIKEEHDRERRFYRGRIRRNNGPSTKHSPGSQKIAPESAIKQYIKTRQKRVGFMKAGWFAAINKLGAPKINGIRKNFGIKGLPSWIKRHASNYGQVGIVGGHSTQGRLEPVEKRLTIVVRNDIGNIFGAAARAATATKVLFVRAGKLNARVGHFQKLAADRFNSGQKQA
jgi:hypothetical protein